MKFEIPHRRLKMRKKAKNPRKQRENREFSPRWPGPFKWLYYPLKRAKTREKGQKIKENREISEYRVVITREKTGKIPPKAVNKKRLAGKSGEKRKISRKKR
jgi:hypothetical protein